jgi:DNA integrity scanning protein DisA with diadenylate cyclase activity
MMLLNIFGFLNISFADILDILMVAIFIYLAFRWIRGSAAMNIFIAVILLFILLCWRFMVIANNAPDLFGALLVVGVMGHIAIQVILNIAVVTGILPSTGIILPFISYGGTAVLFLMAEMGIALGISRRIKLEG